MLRPTDGIRGPTRFAVAVTLIGSMGCSGSSGGNFSMVDSSSDAASVQGEADSSPATGARTNPSSLPREVDASVGSAGQADAGTRSDEDADATSTEEKADAGAGGDDAGGSLGGGEAGGAAEAGGGDQETGRMVGITAAHNAVRAAVQTNPPLPPLVWSQTIADYAQEWATTLATTMCSQPVHRSSAELEAKGYGENLAAFSGGGLVHMASVSTAADAVNAWAAEKACWTYGTIQGSEKCDMTCYTNLHSDGCGHYTQVVWRDSNQLGCGVATCQNGSLTQDIWICNYAPPGNYVGQAPY